MKITLMLVGGILGLSFCDLEQPGVPSTESGTGSNVPKPWKDLYNEFKERLDETIYDAFALAVELQFNNQYEQSAEVYRGLMQVRGRNGEIIDLRKSKTYQHNLRLLNHQLQHSNYQFHPVDTQKPKNLFTVVRNFLSNLFRGLLK